MRIEATTERIMITFYLSVYSPFTHLLTYISQQLIYSNTQNYYHNKLIKIILHYKTSLYTHNFYSTNYHISHNLSYHNS